MLIIVSRVQVTLVSQELYGLPDCRHRVSAIQL